MSTRILTVASGYPSDAQPDRGTFVHVLMSEFRALGVELAVLAPQSAFSRTAWRHRLGPAASAETRDGVEIRRPRYLSFSNKVLPAGLSTYRWTVASFWRAVRRGVRSLRWGPDLCYGHFLYPAGLSAQRLARNLGVPSVVALGESSFEHYERHMGLPRMREDLAGFAKVVAVSEATRERCIERYGASEDRVRVFPNAAAQHFRPRPREEMRRQLGLPEGKPIVAFLGHFGHSKGPDRVLQAIEARKDIGAIFVGSGPIKPTGSQVLFAASMQHDQVPLWLSAADILVHPSLAEGSSNALREAMACGLPVVASRTRANLEFLDSSVGMLVDPLDVDEIQGAIATLIDDPDRRREMGQAALNKATQEASADRARNILEWISSPPEC